MHAMIATQAIKQKGLHNPAMCPDGRHMAGRLEEPESFPFVDERTQVFGGVQQLLYTAFWPSGVDRHKAADRGGQNYSQHGELQDSSHRTFLHERSKSDFVCVFQLAFAPSAGRGIGFDGRVWVSVIERNFVACRIIRFSGFGFSYFFLIQVADFQFHVLSRLERHNVFAGNFDLLASPWIASFASGSWFDFENSKVPKLNPPLSYQAINYGVKGLLYNFLRLLLSQSYLFRDRSHDIFLGHT
ncbi:hypothetical protein RMSM_07705 [Rhodopirellula maiorica SM1]|uniref:Uncharacterized protein n=1 Tax=Rhodopirellula maiorica SM1 TaxID=1265738 RepID=M5R8K4_9BACT|nr:hypothetical protein RMSM_07705 [Rhodopirellula maiorica SM1]